MASQALETLAANIKTLMGAHTELRTDGRLGKAAGIDQKTVWRIVNKKNEPTLEQLSAIAKAYRVEPWQLLVPGMDATNLPVLQPVTAAERELYKRLKETVEAYEDKLREDGNTRPGGLTP